MALADTVRDRVVVLDGGLATELERRGHDLSSRLWSAALLTDDPTAILDVHRAYFVAGAEVATSASYQAAPDVLADLGLDGPALLRRSVALARRARDEHGSGWVAASVGPYGAVLADGSEYRGDYGLTVAQLRRFHRPRLEILAEAGPDAFAVETVPCIAEVAALVAEVERIGIPAWISLTCADGRTRAGEPLAEAFALAADSDTVFAVGVNCTDPAEVTAAVELAVATTGRPAVAYPNSGERWDARRRAWTGRPVYDPADAVAWAATGARLVGGCCRVGPEVIRRIAQRFSSPADRR